MEDEIQKRFKVRAFKKDLDELMEQYNQKEMYESRVISDNIFFIE